MVMSSIERLLKEAVELPEDQRLTLAHRLLASSEPPVSDETEHAWDAAIRDRIRRYDEGSGRARPAGEVLSELDRRLRK
jgi:hypothetical protein